MSEFSCTTKNILSPVLGMLMIALPLYCQHQTNEVVLLFLIAENILPANILGQ